MSGLSQFAVVFIGVFTADMIFTIWKVFSARKRRKRQMQGNKFHKVSEMRYVLDMRKAKESVESLSENTDVDMLQLYKDIKLPKRATKGSAGYDFFAPFDFRLAPGESIKIPTGIKVKIWPKDWFLAIVPRSSLGFKYRLQIDNTFGVIDADYYDNLSNEGHIFIKLTNDSKTGKELLLRKGEAFAQGIFLPFGLTDDDNAEEERAGGIGSTNK